MIALDARMSTYSASSASGCATSSTGGSNPTSKPFISDERSDELLTVKDLQAYQAQRIDRSMKIAKKQIGNITRLVEKAFNKAALNHFTLGEVTICISSVPVSSIPMTPHGSKQLNDRDLYEVTGRNKIAKPDVNISAQRSSDHLKATRRCTVTAYIGEGFINGNEVVIYDDSEISRQWMCDCILASVMEHLSLAGYSFTGAVTKSVEYNLYPKLSVVASWPTDLPVIEQQAD